MSQFMLTRENVLEMEPGEELNGLISKHVFGVDMFAEVLYSTDISAAWDVFNYFKEIGVLIQVGWNPKKKHAWCIIAANGVCGVSSVDISAETEELAICKAALLAVMNI